VSHANADAANNTNTYSYGDSNCYSDSDTYSHADGDSYPNNNTNVNPDRYSQGNTKTTPKSASSPDSTTVEGLAIGSHLRNTCCCRHSAVPPCCHEQQARRRLDAARRLQPLHRARLRDPLPWKMLTDLCAFG
jgi:hypothetical protein